MNNEDSLSSAELPLEEWSAHLHAAKTALVALNPRLAHFFVKLSVTHNNTVHPFPFLSIRAFKEHEIFNKDARLVKRTFCSSGSTSTKPGLRAKKLLSDQGLEAYAQTVVAGFSSFLERFSLNASTPILCLVPRSADWPDSSLAEMFEILRQHSFDVRWCNAESIFSALEGDTRDTVVFGTSFHHVLAAAQRARQNPVDERKHRRIVALDTGGTKGRTQVLSSAAMQRLLIETYKGYGEVSVASEYGMCELTSQAWSSAPGELRKFRSNSSLIPVSVDPVTLRASLVHEDLPGRKTFLAFIDWSNVDTYPALVTEDLGTLCKEPGHFLLLGRAPLASAKGCSLRVETAPAAIALEDTLSSRSLAQQSSFGQPSALQDPPPLVPRLANFSEEIFSEIKDHLLQKIDQAPANLFTAFERELLINAVGTIARTPAGTSGLSAATDTSLKNLGSRIKPHAGSLLIVASANVPITFLFPIIAAFETGYHSVALHLPSLREEDPVSAAVRSQLAWLLQALQESFRNLAAPHPNRKTVFNICETKAELLAIGQSSAVNFDTVIVFGTDQTVSFLGSHFRGKCNTYIGLGEIENFLEVTRNEPQSTALQIARACLAWKGRGCLTPRAVIFDETSFDKSASALETTIAEFRNEYQRIHREEFTAAGDALECYHWHDAIELKAKLGPWARFYADGGSLIIDLTHCSDKQWKRNKEQLRAGLDFSKAGQGLIYLLRKSQISDLGIKVAFLKVNPGYRDLHMGKTWTEWLGNEAATNLERAHPNL